VLHLLPASAGSMMMRKQQGFTLPELPWR